MLLLGLLYALFVDSSVKQTNLMNYQAREKVGFGTGRNCSINEQSHTEKTGIYEGNAISKKGLHNHNSHNEQYRELGSRYEKLGGTATTGSIWVPPTKLQKVIFQAGAEGYQIYFPLELTNKDYHSRILETIARGVQSRVLQISNDKHLKHIPQGNENDVQYLLKQLLGRNSDGNNDSQHIRLLFSNELRCSMDKLHDSAAYVLTQRNLLFNLEQDVTNNTDTVRLFNAAVELLECFGASAGASLQHIHDLRAQYEAHQTFRKQRIAALGWDSSGASAPPISPAVPAPAAGHTLVRSASAPPSALSAPALREAGFRAPITPNNISSSTTSISTSDFLLSCQAVLDNLDQALLPKRRAHIQSLVMLEGYGKSLFALQRDAAVRAENAAAAHLHTLFTQVNNILQEKFAVRTQEWGNDCGKACLHDAMALVLAAEGAIVALQSVEHQAEAVNSGSSANNAQEIKQVAMDLLCKKDELKQLLVVKALSLPVGHEGTLLSGRSLWFARQKDGRSVASLVQASWCVPLVKIVCHQHWLDQHYLQAFDHYTDAPATDHDIARSLAVRLKATRYSASELAATGYSASVLRAARYTASELSTAGYSPLELRLASYSAHELIAAGWEPADLHTAGFSARELRAAGCTSSDLVSSGYSIGVLKAAGYAAGDLIRDGFSGPALKAAGYTANELRAAKCPADQLQLMNDRGDSYEENYTGAELRAAGYSASELAAANYSADDMRAAGYTAAELFCAISIENGQVSQAYGVSELAAAGYSAGELKTSGYSTSDVAFHYRPSELKAAGYTAGDLQAIGYDASSLRQMDYDQQGRQRSVGYSAIEVAAAGYEAYDLKDAGYSAAELRAAGYKTKEVCELQYTAAELATAGYSAGDLRNAGYGAAGLAAAGYTVSELLAAGYSGGEIRHEAGFSREALKTAGQW